MTFEEYKIIDEFMLSHMQDSAHDRHHIYRVLNSAVDIHKHEESVDFDVLVTTCLLHDIGREQQFKDSDDSCHAETGSKMAYNFLLSIGWDQKKALHVRECIASHRFRVNKKPQSIEAKILFDADKLDASGAIGIARTLIYEGQVGESLYYIDDDGNIIIDNDEGDSTSFFQEYNFKLKKVYSKFFTERAKEIAAERQKTAMSFYDDLYYEISDNYKNGIINYMDITRSRCPLLLSDSESGGTT